MELELQSRNSWLIVKDHCVGRSDAKGTVPDLNGTAQGNWWSDCKRQTESLRWSRLQPAHPHTTGDEGQKERQTIKAVRHCLLRRTVIEAAMTNDSVLTVSWGWSRCWDPHYCRRCGSPGSDAVDVVVAVAVTVVVSRWSWQLPTVMIKWLK